MDLVDEWKPGRFLWLDLPVFESARLVDSEAAFHWVIAFIRDEVAVTRRGLNTFSTHIPAFKSQLVKNPDLCVRYDLKHRISSNQIPANLPISSLH